MSTCQSSSTVICLGVVLLFAANEADAQCSRGRSGNSPASMSTQALPFSNFGLADRGLSSGYGSPGLTMNSVPYQVQQRFLAMQRQIAQRQATGDRVTSSQLLANRIERARLTRQRRTERIALAKAAREARRYDASESSATELVSVIR